MAINANQLAAEINRQLGLYSEDLKEELDVLAEKVAKKGVKLLKQRSPRRVKNGGTYAKNWKVKNQNGVWIIHNDKHYRLTHLLEKGHAKVNGGRVSARVHIKPIEREIVNDFINDVEGVVNG